MPFQNKEDVERIMRDSAAVVISTIEALLSPAVVEELEKKLLPPRSEEDHLGALIAAKANLVAEGITDLNVLLDSKIAAFEAAIEAAGRKVPGKVYPDLPIGANPHANNR